MNGFARLPYFAVSRKSLVMAFLFLALALSGAFFAGMQRREDPGTTQRRTEVVTSWPGATTENVEQLVTKKIADDLRGVAHVIHVDGVSRPGISVIGVEFDDEIQNADPVLRDVRNHIDDVRASLPPGIDGPRLVENFWKTYPIVLGIAADDLSPAQLRDLATRLKDRIAALPDVGFASVVGERERQVDVALDLQALAQYGIAPAEVSSAIAARNALVPAGTVAVGGRLAQVDPANPLHGLDVADVTVKSTGDRTIRVGDVARVRVGYPDPPDEIVRVDGRPGIALAIQARETSSVTLLGPEVRDALSRAQQNWPAGVRATYIANQPQTVTDRVNDFGLNLVLAVVIVTVLVALFMGLRNGLLVGATVVLTMALTVGAMHLLSVDINQISLLALIISLGIIVDAGIVAIDNIERKRTAGVSAREAAAAGVSELWFPLLTSTLVAMSSFIPFRLMGGGVGDFVRDLGVVTSLSLAMSLVVAYFVTPILGEWFAVPANSAANPVQRIFDRGLFIVRRAYEPLATAALHRPWIAAGVALTAVVLAVASIPSLGIQFFPSADRNQFFIDVDAAEGTDIRATERIVQQIEARIAREPAITAVGSFIGAGAPQFYYNVLAEQPKPSYAQIIVGTTDLRAADRAIADLRIAVQTIPGARILVKKLEQGPPVGTPIQVRVQSLDAAHADAAADRILGVLRGTPGAAFARTSRGEPTTKIAAAIDETRAAAAGVQNEAIQNVVALAYGGTTATNIREADRQTPVVVRLPARLRDDTRAFGALSVPSTSGALVRLDEIATVGPAAQTSLTTLRDGLPTVIVAAEIAPGSLATDVLAAFRARLADLRLPDDVHVSYGGEDEQSGKAFLNLLVAILVGLFVNQIVLLWEFRTVRLSLVVITAIPLALVGALAGLGLMHEHFGFIAALGISSLGGVVTNHTIVLFEYAKREMADGLSMEHAMIAAGSRRLRPIVLTVVASIAGLVPLATSSQTLWRPFCWTVTFGLGGSMLVTLVVIPALYRLIAGTARAAEPHPAQPALSRAGVTLAGETR